MPARPSAGIGVVEVQKLEVFCVFVGARAIGVVEVQKLEFFCVFFDIPARPSAKTRGFLRLRPLRGSCVSKCSRCGAVRILLSLGEPSAEIVRVEALSLWRRAIFTGAASAGPLDCESLDCTFTATSGGVSTGSVVRGDVTSSGKVSAWPFKVVSCFARPQSRSRGFDSPLVRGSSGLKVAAFKYKRSTRSLLLQLRLENCNF